METEILRMVESVDPADESKLDEIDARVWCFINREDYEPHTDHNVGVENPHGCGNDVLPYSRDRNALKAIRPKGWQFEIEQYWERGWTCAMVKCPENGERINAPVWTDDPDYVPDFFPTEELAELHCIIQVIAHERRIEERA